MSYLKELPADMVTPPICRVVGSLRQTAKTEPAQGQLA